MQYRISAGALYSAWKGGRTLDMSVGGILIDTPEALPVGSTAELAIDWLCLYHGKARVCLLVIGSVVRNDGRGSALRILSHEFREVCTAVIASRNSEEKSGGGVIAGLSPRCHYGASEAGLSRPSRGDLLG